MVMIRFFVNAFVMSGSIVNAFVMSGSIVNVLVCQNQKEPSCAIIVKHKEEIANLKLMIQNLSKEVTEIQNKVPESGDSHIKSKTNTTMQQQSANKQTPKAPNALLQTPKSNNTERNFNIVVYGIIKSPAGTSKSNGVKSDLEKLLQQTQL